MSFFEQEPFKPLPEEIEAAIVAKEADEPDLCTAFRYALEEMQVCNAFAHMRLVDIALLLKGEPIEE